MIVGYCRFLRSRGAILDVGCGEGVLHRRLGSEGYSRFVGIDLSRAAIKRARQQGDDRATFIVADASEFVPEGRFDTIIFNESLYYQDKPSLAAARYAAV